MSFEGEIRRPYISFDRVEGIDIERQFIECYFCHGLVWSPIGCKNCDQGFCSLCIQEFHRGQSKQICPHCKSIYEPKILRNIIPILNGLEITCQYKSNGCEEILSYNDIENHEKSCDYQLFTCNGCEEKVRKKDFIQHKNQCGLISITCIECLTSYKRQDKDLHTETACLRQQVQKLQKKLFIEEEKIKVLEQKFEKNDERWNEFMRVVLEIK